MAKKTISLLLVLCLLLSCGVTAFAEEGLFAVEEASDMEDWEASLGDYTVTDANAYTPTDAKNLMSVNDGGHAYAPNIRNEEKEPIVAEYVAGEVLYAREEGGLSLFSDNSFDAELAELGISGAEVVYTSEQEGKIHLFGSKEETVWYRAEIAGDVLETVDALKEVSGIIHAEPNYIYTTEAVSEPTEAERNHSWYLTEDTADGLIMSMGWDEAIGMSGKAPGDGVVVAVIDTGVDYTHEDLASSMWTNVAELNGMEGVDDDGNGYIDDIYGIDATVNPQFDGAKAGDPMDYNGHGTHVAGIVAMANNGLGGVGIAYGAKIMALKAGQATGTFSSTDIAEAIEYAMAKGADVINMSFGGSGKSSLVENALEDAFATCVLVAAAGNDGLPTTDAPTPPFFKKIDVYPAGYSFVLGVMASDENGELASFSNWDYYANANAEYEVIAPGSNIYSCLPGNRYAGWNGTSMAAPCVAAAAAVLRGCYSDKDEYNSRFIMGQLASATDKYIDYADVLEVVHSYPKLNLYQSLTRIPEPNLRVAEVFALDNVGNGDTNDGDRIMDAGEVIDLGIRIRNQWGKTGEVIIKADAISNGGIANPYVEFITDEITLTPIGAFTSEDNGFVYDDSYLYEVSNPIRFMLAEDTPNDTQIIINLNVTTTNGWDSGDSNTYEASDWFTFRVQRGQAVRGHISEDTTWDKDHYWIIENSVVIDENATLTVEPGTQIQFWSSDYEGAYGGKTMAYINNKGILNMIGTEEEPIEMFPGADFEQFTVDIYGDGVETLKYCDILAPRLGYDGWFGGWTSSFESPVDMCDHCVFTQNYSNQIIRYISDTVKDQVLYYNSYNSISLRQDLDYSFCAGTVKNCRFHNFRGYVAVMPYSPRVVLFEEGFGNLYDNCSVVIGGSTDSYRLIPTEKSSVHLMGRYGVEWTGTTIRTHRAISTETPVFSDVLTYNGASSKYVVMEPFAHSYERELAKALSDSLGGALLCLNDAEEEAGVLEALHRYVESTREEGTNNIAREFYLDYVYDDSQEKWIWGDGSEYSPAMNTGFVVPYKDYPYARIALNNYPDNFDAWLHSIESTYYDGVSYILELPAEMSDAEIEEVLSGFDYDEYYATCLIPYTSNSAILNPVLDTDPEHWLQFVAPEYTTDYRYTIAGNYWGTENDILINKMISDDDDYAGTLADILEDPILTLDDDLSNIYPFVTEIWITEAGGDTEVEELTPGVTYDVHVTYNRDMDSDVQPMITYGGEAPFTDYVVHGDWTSDREWVGTTCISYIATGGTQIFRAKGGAAADDNWLVCGTDELRFQFDIESTSAQSMVLNATGGIDQVELRWAQNDFEVLAGYNLYRSTSADGVYSLVNTDGILSDTIYVDTNVDAGVTYYYYFTVVDTDGNEIADTQSNIASAAPLDNVKPVIVHTPVANASAGSAVSVSATVTDNLGVGQVMVYYRSVGEELYSSRKLSYSSTTKIWTATIPAEAVTTDGVQYYLEATDTTGNKAWSGSNDVPYLITTDSTPTLLVVSPSTINVTSKPDTLTVYGTNFVEGMTVTVGTITIEAYTVNDDGTEITFATPDLPVGNYAVRVAAGEKSAVLANALIYRDVSSYVQINAASVTSGETLRLPLYVGMTGALTAFHAEIQVPSAYFSVVSVELADGISASLSQNYSGDVLTISMAAANSFNPGTQAPLAYLVLTPNVVAQETAVQLNLTSGKLNGAETVTKTVSTSVVLYPNFRLNATVQYYKDAAAVPDVTISAAGVTGITGADGKAELSGITRADVTVLATKEGYSDTVEAYDAVLILQHCAGVLTTPLDASQLIAGDVDADGDVDEVDASLILKKYAKLIDFFPAGSWKFTPASQSVMLDAATTDLTFTAIMIGDVDGSWASGE